MFKWYFDWKRRPKDDFSTLNTKRWPGSKTKIFTVNESVFIYNGKRMKPGDPGYSEAKASFDRGMKAGMQGLDAGMKALDSAMKSMERMFDDDSRRK